MLKLFFAYDKPDVLRILKNTEDNRVLTRFTPLYHAHFLKYEINMRFYPRAGFLEVIAIVINVQLFLF